MREAGRNRLILQIFGIQLKIPLIDRICDYLCAVAYKTNDCPRSLRSPTWEQTDTNVASLRQFPKT